MAILGKVRFNLKGEWSSSISYLIDDVVIYKNRTYRCKVAHSNSVPPNTTNWEPMVTTFDDMGLWNSSTAYKVGDIVTVDASLYASASHPRDFTNGGISANLTNPIRTYICIADNSNTAPTNTTYWQPMTESGGNGFKKFLWAPNWGIVPANFYGSGSNPGWAPTTARPGDSFYDGGLGFAKEGQMQFKPGFITRTGGIVTYGRSDSGSSANGGDNEVHTMFEVNFPFNEWFDGTLPTPDGLAPKVIQWEMGYSQSLVLMNNGEVYHWGYGGHGQNGSGNNNSINFPVRCGNNNNTTVLRGKKAIRIAMSHAGGQTAQAASCYALMSDGTLWAWGYNGYGQLGLNNTTNYNVPTQITTSGLNGTVVDIWACGGDYGSLWVLTSTGYMYACGRNAQGQLGVNDTLQKNVLTLVKIWGTTTTRVKKFIISDRQDATFCAVIDGSNNLWTWGHNNYGQLGHNDTTNRSTPTQVTFNGTDVRNCWVAAGNNQSMYVTRTSTLQPYSCGYNGYYNLGRSYTDTNRTHANNGNSTTAWDTYRLQPMYFETTTTAPYYGTLTNVINMRVWHADDSHTAVMVEQIDGTKYCGGYNGYGHWGFHHSDSYLTRTRDCAGNATNYLFKRLRYLPSGVKESELDAIPVGFSGGRFAALWYDRDGTMYHSGYVRDSATTAYYNLRKDQANGYVSWAAPISKLPEA
jgi:alpha-tubulin suppressor-like RCC1 family protein